MQQLLKRHTLFLTSVAYGFNFTPSIALGYFGIDVRMTERLTCSECCAKMFKYEGKHRPPRQRQPMLLPYPERILSSMRLACTVHEYTHRCSSST